MLVLKAEGRGAQEGGHSLAGSRLRRAVVGCIGASGREPHREGTSDPTSESRAEHPENRLVRARPEKNLSPRWLGHYGPGLHLLWPESTFQGCGSTSPGPISVVSSFCHRRPRLSEMACSEHLLPSVLTAVPWEGVMEAPILQVDRLRTSEALLQSCTAAGHYPHHTPCPIISASRPPGNPG